MFFKTLPQREPCMKLSTAWVKFEYEYCWEKRLWGLRNVHSLKYQMQESRVIMRILYDEQRPALIVLGSFSPFTLLQQLGLSFCCLMPSLRIFAHAPPSAWQFFLFNIHTVISSSSLRSHLSITSSNMTFLPIPTKISLSGTCLFLYLIIVCLHHWNVSSMSAEPLPSCYLYIEVLVPRRLLIHTWASHPIIGKENIDQRRAYGIFRRL